MIPVKIECACGQRYAFDVEPYKGAMPSRVACPTCGADGTHSANDCIAEALAAQPAPTPAASMRLNVSAAPPPIPPVPTPPASPPSASRPQPQRAVQRAEAAGKDGWGSEETSFNKLGIYITITPAIVAAMFSWGMFGVQVPAPILCAVVGVCGLIGGAINLAGRGPILAGAIIGLLIGLGGYGAVYWWIQDRQSVHKFELAIAFAAGCGPGFLLQFVLQKIWRKRGAAEEREAAMSR